MRKVIAAALGVSLGLAIALWLWPLQAANNPYGIVKGVNGQWPVIQCGSGTTPQSCTEHWVLGSGSQDPPNGYGSDGDLFWRNDLLTFRTRTAGVWGPIGTTGQSLFLSTPGAINLGSSAGINFMPNFDPSGVSPDVRIGRADIGVLSVGNGASVPTWLIFGGNSHVGTGNGADYSNATTGFTSLVFSPPNSVSGRQYTFDMSLLMTESVAAEGMKIDFAGGAMTISSFSANCVLTNAVGAVVSLANATTTALATVINVASMTDTAQHMLRCSGGFIPTNTASFVIRAAQNSHASGTLTVSQHSRLAISDVRQ